MNNPYLVLRVTPDSTDAEIRRAYLDGVREFPPERDPERFQAIAQAYELIRDEPARLRYYLFNHELPGGTPAETFANYCAAAPVPKPLPFEEMKAFLRACST
jgi:curved DNA-binding protein CbpA